jgi:hypothetical protein
VRVAAAPAEKRDEAHDSAMPGHGASGLQRLYALFATALTGFEANYGES